MKQYEGEMNEQEMKYEQRGEGGGWDMKCGKWENPE